MNTDTSVHGRPWFSAIRILDHGWCSVPRNFQIKLDFSFFLYTQLTLKWPHMATNFKFWFCVESFTSVKMKVQNCHDGWYELTDLSSSWVDNFIRQTRFNDFMVFVFFAFPPPETKTNTLCRKIVKKWNRPKF